MNPAITSVHDLSRQLIAREALCDSGSVNGENLAIRVCEKLRVSLIKFAGIAGYRTLVVRALSMAKVEAPLLEPVNVCPDGSLEGFDRIFAEQEVEAAEIVLVNLLLLLVTFIGERQTLALASDGWPLDALGDVKLKTEEQK